MAGSAKSVCIVGGMCTGHDTFPPRACISGSDNVFVNGKGVHRAGDTWAVHCDKDGDHCHDSSFSTGSGTVFVNGKAAARMGDRIDCGSYVAQGSSNVFFG